MSTSIVAADFEAASNQFIANARRKMVADNMPSSSASDQSVFVDESGDSDYYGYKSVDGSDDGKISFWEKAKCAINGVGKSLLNMVTGAFKNPIKTIATVAACCIPVVGPVLMGALAVKGIVGGISQVAQAASVASNASTDAEAMAAWENIGSGGFQAGASLFGLKGAGSLMKSQLTGASTTVNALRSGNSSLGQVAGEAIRETGRNMGAVAKVTASKITRVGEGIRNIYQGIKTNGFTSYFGGKFNQLIGWGKAKTNSIASKVEEKIDNFGKNSEGVSLADRIKNRFSKTGKIQAEANAEAAVKRLEELKTNPAAKKTSSGYEVKETGVGGKETTSVYDSNGYLKETVTKTTQNGTTTTETVSYNRNGSVTTRKTTQAPVEGTVGQTVEKVETYGKLGSHKTTTTTKTPKADGAQTRTIETTKETTFGNTVRSKTVDSIAADKKVTEVYSYRYNQRTGVASYKRNSELGSTSVRQAGNGKTYQVRTDTTTVNDKASSATTYRLGDSKSSTTTPSLTERAQAYAHTTNTGVRLNRFVGSAKEFANNPFYRYYSWYEATKDENE